MGGTEYCIDIGGHVESRCHKSIRALISCARSVTRPAPHINDKCEPEGEPVAEDGGG